MKKRILLIDESLTVQKVVALTLDRERYTLINSKSRSEAMKIVLEEPPDLILVSDQVAGISASAFPKEVEAWAGRDRRQPPLVLITNQDIREQRGYRAVLKKPFAPQALQAAVTEALAESVEDTGVYAPDEGEDTRLQKIFNDAFADEARLASQTLQTDTRGEESGMNMPRATARPATRPSAPPATENVADFWGKAEETDTEVHVLGPEDSMAYKAQLEKEVGRQLESYDLEDMVHRLLEKVVPPIVEKLAQERLDQLLKESESFVELKP